MLIGHELKCRDQLAKILGQLAKTQTNCLVKCRKMAPLGFCPAGGVSDCWTDALQTATAKAAKSCGSDGTDSDSCPEGYEFVNGDCASFVAERAVEINSLVDLAGVLLSCDDEPLNEAEAKCQIKAMQAYGKWGAARGNCFRKCRIAEAKGKDDGNCDPSGVTDTKNFVCLSKEEAKLTAKLASACPDEPEWVDPDLLRDQTVRPLVDDVARLASNPSTTSVCGNDVAEYPESCDPPGPTGCVSLGGIVGTCSASCACTFPP